jgi:hypothetical protein
MEEGGIRKWERGNGVVMHEGGGERGKWIDALGWRFGFVCMAGLEMDGLYDIIL